MVQTESQLIERYRIKTAVRSGTASESIFRRFLRQSRYCICNVGIQYNYTGSIARMRIFYNIFFGKNCRVRKEKHLFFEEESVILIQAQTEAARNLYIKSI